MQGYRRGTTMLRSEPCTPNPEPEHALAPKDLVDRPLRERDDKQVAVRSSLDIGSDPEVPVDQQAFAPGDLVLGEVVRHPVLQPCIVYADLPTVTGQVE